jgi:hypothetical protein
LAAPPANVAAVTHSQKNETATLSKHSFAFLMLRAACALALAVICWAILGYLATAPLGALYGWSGHPAVPAAPVAVYVMVYLIVLPVVCLIGAWKTVVILGRKLPAQERP